MPNIREFSVALGVGKNTISTAYTRLVAENYLVTNRRRGTEVSKLRFGPSIPTCEANDPAPYGRVSESIEISYQARRALALRQMTGAEIRAFALSIPDPSLYPRNHLSRYLTAEFCRSPATDTWSGWTRFQTAIAGYLRHMRGVHCEPNQVIPLTSLESALDLTARVLVDPAHCVLAEDPAITSPWETFKAAGAHLFPLSADHDGADPARARCPPPRLIFVSPSLNFPFGAQMPENRRLALLELAQKAGSVIFELDVGWELSWSSRVQSIQGLAGGRQIIYFGSLYETLGPHLRVAYLVVPAALAMAFTEMAKRIGYGPDGFVLSALATFIEENEYAMHVKALRAAYARRMGIALAACRSHLQSARLFEPSGGFHLALRFGEGFDEECAARSAARLGLAVSPLSQFYHAIEGEKGLVLGLGVVPDRNIETYIRRLAEAVDQARTPDPIYELAS